MGIDVGEIRVGHDLLDDAAHIDPAECIVGVQCHQSNFGIGADVFRFAASFGRIDEDVGAVPRAPDDGVLGRAGGGEGRQGGEDGAGQQVNVCIGNLCGHCYAPEIGCGLGMRYCSSPRGMD